MENDDWTMTVERKAAMLIKSICQVTGMYRGGKSLLLAKSVKCTNPNTFTFYVKCRPLLIQWLVRWSNSQNEIFILRDEVEETTAQGKKLTGRKESVSPEFPRCLTELTRTWPQNPPLTDHQGQERWDQKKRWMPHSKVLYWQNNLPVWPSVWQNALHCQQWQTECWLTRVLHLAWCALANK